jgi:hypothetical protein
LLSLRATVATIVLCCEGAMATWANPMLAVVKTVDQAPLPPASVLRRIEWLSPSPHTASSTSAARSVRMSRSQHRPPLKLAVQVVPPSRLRMIPLLVAA